LIVLASGVSLLVIGRVSAINIIEELSLPVTIWGTVLLVLGRQITQALTFPLAYLFTMIPFWDVFTGRLHLPFQLYSAAVGVTALRLLDIPVFHHATFIELPNITLEVAEVCSGVNNLVAVLCIGIPLTHYYVQNWWKRGAIVVAAILIALISNGVRVATVSLFAYYEIRGADGDIHGPFSLARSLIISGVGFLALFWMIARFADKSAPAPTGESVVAIGSPPSPATPLRLVTAVGLAIVLLVVAGSFDRWHVVEPVPLPERLVGFPVTIGHWESSGVTPEVKGLRALDFDDSLLRTYISRDGQRVDLFLGYLAGQRQGRELGETGLLGSLGLSSEAAETRGLGSGEVRDILATDGRGYAYLAYAYVVDGDAFAGDYKAKWLMMRNTLLRRRNNGGMLVVAARVPPGETLDQAGARYREFVEGAVTLSTVFLRTTR
jgi:EpsI family protein